MMSQYEGFQNPLCQTTGEWWYLRENTNQALAYTTGDYCGLVDHDDILTPDALYEMARGDYGSCQ